MPATPERLQFMSGHVTIHLAQADNIDGISILEHHMARDFGPPLHIHHEEAETFHILSGRLRFHRDGEILEAGPGATIHLPKGSRHTFRVLSDEARALTITNGPFERMVRAASRPADSDALPPQIPPSLEQQQALAEICAAHQIDLVGPPID
ncbi:cupin domain-containing protein [Plastoroseomonas arctica]|uniref:Cupin domain-containing protein n=1 Tax=Plastoroseomonas arctica TaxID=1509237 RepID=A0AAF1K152_9PROT|nr:cupin domain-containing protein [Plastoroseomonas arctica]MBR0657143.1 cupin domain-containing protein [Plastoroseomonas arctica]